jgi:hypothetical protein
LATRQRHRKQQQNDTNTSILDGAYDTTLHGEFYGWLFNLNADLGAYETRYL